MSEKKKRHYKSMTNPDYLGSWDFEEGESRVLVINSIKKGEVVGEGGKKDECVVEYFTTGLPMVLNVTNMKAITLAHGTPYVDDWVGKSISVHVEQVRAFGDIWDALRVSTEAPVISEPTPRSKPILKKDSEEYDKVVAFLKGQKDKEFEVAFSGPNKKYRISATLRAQLENEHKS